MMGLVEKYYPVRAHIVSDCHYLHDAADSMDFSY